MNQVEINLFNKEIERYGSTVTIRSVTTTYNTRGDAKETNTDTPAKAVINIADSDSSFVKEGVLIPGDKIFFLKSDSLGLDVNNILLHDSTNYRIKKVLKHELNDTTYLFEVAGGKEE